MKRFQLQEATLEDVPALMELTDEIAQDQARQSGGEATSKTTEKSILWQMRMSRIFIAKKRTRIIATLRLTVKKPWAINVSYFTPCKRPVYLLGMMVTPELQRQGLGRKCLKEAERIARAWPADAIRLDAYDSSSGAGGFYAKCGYAEVGRKTYRDSPLIYYELILK